ncbi:BarA-associated response regulator UvrY (= GacA = SirA) [hydrothermal vent metagenome]|uniref:BarA-associated response regulator UvrY (= GacA = SirA) n=1 Tax=hydrothermal vent metagenome TaxID=652676 RepID=A0A3B1B4P4_9ZZZZ
MIRVLLVDDHELVRTGFRHILEETADVEVVGEASSAEEAAEMVKINPPDLVLMDVNMPGIGGIEGTRRVLRINPEVKIIALAVNFDSPFPNQLYEAGAIGYLTKGCPVEDMLKAIRLVAIGKPYISSKVSQQLALAQMIGLDVNMPFDKVSLREMQVLMMIIQGTKTQKISTSLCLSPKTVSTYRHRLYEKLEVETDVELAYLAIRHGLVEAHAYPVPTSLAS